MKKLTREEKDNLVLKPKGRSSYIRTVCENMKEGDIILLEPKDFTWKSKAPYDFIRRLHEKGSKRYTCLKVMDGSGWVIERVK